jgi:hypothetical protein
MDTLPHELVIQHILTKAPQLGLTCKEFYVHLPKISRYQNSNIRFPSAKNINPLQVRHENLTFEYESRIDFAKLNELLEDKNVQELNISTTSDIFLEIKRFFTIILENHISIIDGWKYKSNFMRVDESQYDVYKHRKDNSFLHTDWITMSFVMSFIISLNE